MKVLVTGATGFLAREIVLALAHDEGCVVHGAGRDKAKLEQLVSDCRALPGRFVPHVMHLPEIPGLIKGLSHIVHAAAVRSASSGAEVLDMLRVNVEGTLRLLRLAALQRRLCFVLVSSQSVYGSSGAPWSESARLAPQGPYAISKYVGERIAMQFAEDLGIVIVRPSHLYGVTPLTRWTEFPGYLVQPIVRGESIEVHGTGEQRFDLIHVTDAAQALVRIVKTGPSEQPRIYNIGSGRSVSVNEMVSIVSRLAEERELEPVRVHMNRDHPRGGYRHLELDITRVQQELGWSPKVTIEQGLAEYLEAAETVH